MQLNVPQQPVPHSVQLGLLPVLFHLAPFLKGQYGHINVIESQRRGRLEAGQQKGQSKIPLARVQQRCKVPLNKLVTRNENTQDLAIQQCC